MAPVKLSDWVATNVNKSCDTLKDGDGALKHNVAVLCGPGATDESLRNFQFKVELHSLTGNDSFASTAGDQTPHFTHEGGSEVFIYHLPLSTVPTSSCSSLPVTTVKVSTSSDGATSSYELLPGFVMMVPGGGRYNSEIQFPSGGSATLVSTNSAFDKRR